MADHARRAGGTPDSRRAGCSRRRRAREIAEGLCAHAQETLVADRARRAEFQTTVLDGWGNAIDRLELVLMLCAPTRGPSLGRGTSSRYANA